MAVNFQEASTPLPGDLPFYNYTGTDIGPNLGVIPDPTNIVGTAGDGLGVTLPPTSATIFLGVGVTMETVKAGGSAGKVRTAGIAVMLAFAAYNPGQVLQLCGTAGSLGFAQAQAGGKAQIGIALSASGANGDQILVLLQPANNA